jgi:hypothetical protein
VSNVAGRETVELKIPARGPFVVVAKRAAAALGSAAGFTLEGIDEINIAVAQACEKAIEAGDRMWGPDNAILKLNFRLVPGGIELEVKTMPARDASVDVVTLRGEADIARRDAALARRAAQQLQREVVAERQERIRAQREAASLRGDGQPVRARRGPTPTAVDLEDVAVNMIRLFVDELRYNVDSHGSMRMRMVKYLVD